MAHGRGLRGGGPAARHQLWLAAALLALLAATALVYRPGLDGPLLLDDHATLEPLQTLDADPGSWWDLALSNRSGPVGRPLAMLSLVGNRLASGDDIRSLKHTNLMVHLLCGVLVLWLAGRLLQEWGPARAWPLALAVAALWLLAPMYASTVLYVVQRMAQLAALFSLAGLLCYVAGRQQAGSSPRRAGLLMASTFVLWTPLAVLSKESGVMLPALAVLTEIFVFQLRGPGWVRRFVLGAAVLFVLAPGALLGLWLWLDPASPMAVYNSRGFTLSDRLLTQARVQWAYLAQLVAPRGAELGIYHDDFPVSRGLLDPPGTLPAVLGLMLLVGWVAGAWRSRHRFVAFGLAFFLLAQLTESSILPLEIYFEHRTYLAGFGVYLALVAAAGALAAALPAYRRALAALGLVLSLAAGLVTANRALAWQSAATLLGYAQISHPDSPRARSDIALFHARQGDLPQALRHADRILELEDGSQRSVTLLRLILHCLARQPPGEREYADLDGARTRPDRRDIFENVRILTDLTQRGLCPGLDPARVAGALQEWMRAQPEAPAGSSPWKVHAATAKLWAEAGRHEQALASARQAEALSEDPVPRLMVAYYLIRTGSLDEAARRVADLEREAGAGGDAALRRTLATYRELLAHAGGVAVRPGEPATADR